MAEGKSSVMLVDDEEDLLIVTARKLESEGYTVHSFSDPALALHHIEYGGCKECSILVSDIRMPRIDGFQLVHRIRELRPDMKVIIMTAFEADIKEVQAALPSTLIHGVVRKPFPPSKLIDAIKQAQNHQERRLM